MESRDGWCCMIDPDFYGPTNPGWVCQNYAHFSVYHEVPDLFRVVVICWDLAEINHRSWRRCGRWCRNSFLVLRDLSCSGYVLFVLFSSWENEIEDIPSNIHRRRHNRREGALEVVAFQAVRGRSLKVEWNIIRLFNINLNETNHLEDFFENHGTDGAAWRCENV